MTWTIEKPTRRGWYWAKLPEPYQREVLEVFIAGNGELWVGHDEDERPLSEFDSRWQWAGPIPEPTEGK